MKKIHELSAEDLLNFYLNQNENGSISSCYSDGSEEEERNNDFNNEQIDNSHDNDYYNEGTGYHDSNDRRPD